LESRLDGCIGWGGGYLANLTGVFPALLATELIDLSVGTDEQRRAFWTIQNLYTAAFIGLGDIAWRYDHRMPGNMLTHFSAYQTHSDIRVVAGYDPDEQARDEFSNSTLVDVHECLDDLLSNTPDIVSITSPTEFHAQHLARCLEAEIPMVWLEKPAAHSCEDLLKLIKMQETSSTTTVLVGFQRRYLPVYRRLKTAIETRSMGNCVCLSIVYSRGLLTNGVHLVDLLHFLTGIDSKGEIVRIEDRGTDSSPSFIYKTSELECTITGVDLDYHSIDISAHFTEGRIQILHGGLTEIIENKVSNSLYPGFSHLAVIPAQSRSRQELRSDISSVMSSLLNDLISSHCAECSPASDLRSSLVAQEIVERVLQ